MLTFTCFSPTGQNPTLCSHASNHKFACAYSLKAHSLAPARKPLGVSFGGVASMRAATLGRGEPALTTGVSNVPPDRGEGAL